MNNTLAVIYNSVARIFRLLERIMQMEYSLSSYINTQNIFFIILLLIQITFILHFSAGLGDGVITACGILVILAIIGVCYHGIIIAKDKLHGKKMLMMSGWIIESVIIYCLLLYGGLWLYVGYIMAISPDAPGR